MAAGRPLAPLALTDEERNTLLRWARRPKTAQALACRAQIVLACAAGSSNGDAAHTFRVTRQTVGKWRSRFVVNRLDGLLDEPRRHRAVEFRKFLDRIDNAVPESLDLHLILDNYGTHKTPAIRAWLAKPPRYHVHFTPTGASWLNMVERWFAALTEKQIRRGTHRSTRQLETAIKDYLSIHNANPKPLVWTKTPEEIFASLARFCKRINDSGH